MKASLRRLSSPIYSSAVRHLCSHTVAVAPPPPPPSVLPIPESLRQLASDDFPLSLRELASDDFPRCRPSYLSVLHSPMDYDTWRCVMDLRERRIQSAAQYAVEEYNRKKHAQFELVNIQVAGWRYDMRIEVKDASSSETVLYKVNIQVLEQAWLKSKKLIFWRPVVKKNKNNASFAITKRNTSILWPGVGKKQLERRRDHIVG